jgi:hypothetical protein
MAVNFSVTLDPNLVFTFNGTRLAENDPLIISAPSGVDVVIQINAPMPFTASHDDKGKAIAWTPVPTTDGSSAMTWTFPCPRSPFTLTASTTGAAPAAKTKKVRIEARASGAARDRGVHAGNEKPGQ